MIKLTNNILNFKASKYLEFLPELKKEKPQKISGVVLSLIAFSFFGLFAINPTLSTIAKLRKDLADSKFVHEKLQKKIYTLYSLQQKYNSIQDDIPIVLAAVPQDPQIPTLMGQVQTIARNNNISIKSMQSFQIEAANTEKPRKDFYSFSFAITGEGEYGNIISFLTSVTNVQRVVSVDSISITKRSSSQNLEFNVRATAYFKD